jgi:secreted trypsin-like serine protease
LISVAKMIREVIVLFLGLVVVSALPWDPVDMPGYPLYGLKETQEIENFIVGGSAATLGQFPWQAGLRTGGGQLFCGAVIISNRWVLSAAHCTINRDLVISFRVVVGSVNHQTATEFSLARGVVNHPQYDRDTIANE